VRKIRVGVLFGGRSGEHEVSLASATSILGALDPERFEAVPIGITRRGDWRVGTTPDLLGSDKPTELPEGATPQTAGALVTRRHPDASIDLIDNSIDVVFPVLHGPFGEDGTVQGLLAMAGIPFVGSGVLGSALAMDKWRMKDVFAQWGLPNVPYVAFPVHRWRRDPRALVDSLESRLRYPMFVKPSNMGSSVGITKADGGEALRAGIEAAAQYDTSVIVEEGVDGREVECGVLGNDDPQVSVPGEIVPHHEFYDYEAKYAGGLADLFIPAKLSETQSEQVRAHSLRAFQAVGASGLARVDFFVRRDDGAVLVNEINTMPGFTSTSMYPRLWEASGVPYSELITRLIVLAIERHEERERLRVDR
jgi:D-alanine-D-alanine ligase